MEHSNASMLALEANIRLTPARTGSQGKKTTLPALSNRSLRVSLDLMDAASSNKCNGAYLYYQEVDLMRSIIVILVALEAKIRLTPALQAHCVLRGAIAGLASSY